MADITVNINGIATSVPEGITVLQACELAGFGDDVPRFCYHKRLGVAGNCRRCLVEIEKNIKPQASCARPVMPNMGVFTNSPQVKKARESVMEFLLRHHPLDCPICDQGGECDLQDQARHYGSDRSRYNLVKRSVEDKDWGPLVKTVMTRCIQCTRCVRFASEVAGVAVVGATGRGNQVEIGMYTEKPFLSEISGNVVDLCPVGALTAGASGVPFSFRPWELRSVDAIDVTDSSLAPLRYQFRGGALRRILPREETTSGKNTSGSGSGSNVDGIGSKGEWITDKARYSPLDGSTTQRVLKPSVKVGQAKRWASADRNILKDVLSTVVPTNVSTVPSVRIVHGGNIDCRGLSALIEWAKAQSGNCRVETVAAVTGDDPMSQSPESNEVKNVGNSASTKESTGVLLIGYNPRLQNALLNVRLREHFLAGGLVVAVGGAMDLTYQVLHAGFNSSKVGALDSALSELNVKVTSSIVGSDLCRRSDSVQGISDVKGSWHYGFTRSNEAYVGSESGTNKFTVSKGRNFNLQIIVGLTEAEVDASGYSMDQRLSSARYNVVLASQGAEWMKKADMIIPVRNDIEAKSLFKSSNGTYLTQAVTSRALVSKDIPTVEEVFERVISGCGVTAAESETNSYDFKTAEVSKLVSSETLDNSRSKLPYTVSMVDHHLEGHAFAESSSTMARCSAVFAEHRTNFN